MPNLTNARIEIVERSGVTGEDLPPNVTMGLRDYYASQHVIGCGFGDRTVRREESDFITRMERESVDAMVWRAARELVPSLPDSAPRDAQGRAMGYLIYSGLPEDHCRPKP